VTPPLPASTRRAPRWGLFDVAGVYLASLIIATIGEAIALGIIGAKDLHHLTTGQELRATIAILYVQGIAMIVAVALVALWRGATTSLRHEFGFVVHLRNAPWLLAGFAINVVGSLIIAPLNHLHGKAVDQHVVTVFKTAHGAQFVLFAVAVAVLAPLSEELLFRGLLLRSLLREMPTVAAVCVAAAVFAAAHLIDPSAYIAVVPLAILALISGTVAVRNWDLSRSIYLHIGFNLLTVIAIGHG
jgi:membrane protease YdiL (CAAX protease family)